jgi:hypothetical protein
MFNCKQFLKYFEFFRRYALLLGLWDSCVVGERRERNNENEINWYSTESIK